MNHTSLCDTSLFYVLLTRSMFIVTTRHPCLLDEHHHVYLQKDNVAYCFHIALILYIAIRLQIYKKYVNPTIERQKFTLFQHFFLDLLHFSNTIYPYFLHFSNNLMFSFINVVVVTRPRFWYWLTLFSLHLCVLLGVMHIYNVKFRLNRQFSV